MDDGYITVRIDEDLAADVMAAAAACGLPVEAYVNNALNDQLSPQFGQWVDPDPTIDKAIIDDAFRTGNLVPADKVIAWMRSWFTDHELPEPIPDRR